MLIAPITANANYKMGLTNYELSALFIIYQGTCGGTCRVLALYLLSLCF